jgi:hypothetical protein
MWMLKKFNYKAQRTKSGNEYILWKEAYHAKQIKTNKFLKEKLDYIHNNPVEGGYVSKPEGYIYRSARDYCGEMGRMNVDIK